MRKFIPVLFSCIILFLASAPGYSQGNKKAYMKYINDALEYNMKESNNIINNWKSNIKESELFGYSPTSYPAHFAELLGFKYEQTGKEKYAKKAAELLLMYEEFKKIFPKEYYENRVEFAKGLPPISNFFSMSCYPRAYLYIRNSKKISEKDRAIIEQGVADCANFLFNYPEWGPMNRAILRSETFFFASFALPDHPDAKKWAKMAQVLSSDSYQRWEEEDATSYHPVWLLSIMRVVDTIKDKDFYNSAIPRYYMDYFTNLIHPYGLIPDFGDGQWPSDWYRFIPIFEKGAAEYKNGNFKWAANQTWDFNQKYYPEHKSAYVALAFVNAYKWCDESIKPVPPKSKSRLVMEDVVGKKIVFRNGVSPKSTYMLLTYRDEGDGAYAGREFLRSTICAEEEKTHHGHSDENSIVTLFYNGSVLLHDAGYRPALPSGDYGEFRADYYHNRMVVRKNKVWKRITGENKVRQNIWEFLRNSGAYKPVDTKLINFLNFEKVDYSRSRLSEPNMGYEWDRTVIYNKEEQYFVVVDAMKSKIEDYFTFTNLWHTQNILETGERWFDTRIDSIRNFKIPGGNKLLVYFPVKEDVREVGQYNQRRHYQDEITMYETLSDHYYPEQSEVFVTILVPHKDEVKAADIVKRFEIIETNKYPQSIAIKYKDDKKTDYYCIKLDLMLGYRQQNVRTRYQYELGKVNYGPLQTDGEFLYSSITGDDLYWAAANMVGVKYNKKQLHESLKLSIGLQLDSGPFRDGRAKWRYWEDNVKISSLK